MTRYLTLLLALAACTPSKPDETAAIDQDGDGYTALLDCDDSSSAISPGATEVCNGLDDDCDGSIDNGGETARYSDADRDGYGDPNAALTACDGAGVADHTDCDDADANINPAATDVEDGLDNNCDGDTDEGAATDSDSGEHDTGDSGHTGHDSGRPDSDEPPETGGWVDSGRDTDVDIDTGGGSTDDGPFFEATWVADTLLITISGGRGTYTLGISETDPASTDPWTGEDCLDGYTTGSGTVYLYCHPLSSTGGLFIGGGSATHLDEDTETVFTGLFEDSVTYAVWSDSTLECWTWGEDPSYYRSAGCEVL